MKRLLNNNGFASILEVIVSSIIFMTAAVGFFTSVSMMRPQSNDSTKKLAALYAGRSVAEELRGEVYGNLWNHSSSNLRPGVLHTRSVGIYTINYILTDDPNLSMRRLDMNIYYPD